MQNTLLILTPTVEEHNNIVRRVMSQVSGGKRYRPRKKRMQAANAYEAKGKGKPRHPTSITESENAG
jgi:hypothetical protein